MEKLKMWGGRCFIGLLLLLGLGLVFNTQIAVIVSHWGATHYMNESAQEMADNRHKGSYDLSKVKSINSLDVINNAWKSQHYPVIGLISIPKLQINLPIFSGVSYDELLVGAGTLRPDEIMGKGNYPLASHHVFPEIGIDTSKMLFSNLVNAKIGQKIYMTDKAKIYVYQIDDVETIGQVPEILITNHEITSTSTRSSFKTGKSSKKSLKRTEKEVTLITCADLEASSHLIVHGKYLKTMKFSEKTAKVFTQQFNQDK